MRHSATVLDAASIFCVGTGAGWSYPQGATQNDSGTTSQRVELGEVQDATLASHSTIRLLCSATSSDSLRRAGASSSVAHAARSPGPARQSPHAALHAQRLGAVT